MREYRLYFPSHDSYGSLGIFESDDAAWASALNRYKANWENVNYATSVCLERCDPPDANGKVWWNLVKGKRFDKPAPPVPPETCVRCAFWRRNEKSESGTVGECRRHTPIGDSRWHQTVESDWCGEWKERE